MIKKIISFTDLSNFVASIVDKIKANSFILLSGDLGAGKTTFTKELLKQLGVRENVTSPTFVIMNQYISSFGNINHIDAYRLKKGDIVDEFVEYFDNSLNIIEWYENFQFNFKTVKGFKISIKIVDENIREFEMEEL